MRCLLHTEVADMAPDMPAHCTQEGCVAALSVKGNFMFDAVTHRCVLLLSRQHSTCMQYS